MASTVARSPDESDGDGAVPPRIVELIAAIGREHELHAQPLGRLAEHPDLIARRRRQEQDSLHRVNVSDAITTGPSQCLRTVPCALTRP